MENWPMIIGALKKKLRRKEPKRLQKEYKFVVVNKEKEYKIHVMMQRHFQSKSEKLLIL